MSSEARLDGINRVPTFLCTMNKEGLPVILTGDFNNDSEEATEVEAVKRHHLLDTFRVVHPDAFAYSYHAFRGRPESCKAGFVFVSPDVRVGGRQHRPCQASQRVPFRPLPGDRHRRHLTCSMYIFNGLRCHLRGGAVAVMNGAVTNSPPPLESSDS